MVDYLPWVILYLVATGAIHVLAKAQVASLPAPKDEPTEAELIRQAEQIKVPDQLEEEFRRLEKEVEARKAMILRRPEDIKKALAEQQQRFLAPRWHS